MPLYLLVLLGLGGGIALYEATKSGGGGASGISPSGKAWPAGVTAADARAAVSAALARETDPLKLRDFARQIGPYDNAAFAALNAHASALQGSTPSAAALPPSGGGFSQAAGVHLR